MRIIAIQSAILVLVIYILPTAYAGYRYWFDIEGFLDKYRQRWEKMPNWFPLRAFYLNKTNERAWVWIMRIYSAVALIASTSILFLLLKSLFAG